MASLRSWLRQQPQPHKIRIRTGDDEDVDIELSPNARNRWKQAEESVIAAEAKTVHCLDKSGAILRSQQLAVDSEGASEPEDPTTKMVRSERRELAAVLDRYGDRMNQAFDRGAAAASAAQENMIALVETLTAHLSLAITNLHNVSVNLANALSGEPTEPQSKGELALAALAAKILSASGGGHAAEEKPNGKRKGA